MAAGLLTYRLCDRCYECDGCPLDAAMRGVELAPGGTGARPAADAGSATETGGDGPRAVTSAWGIRDDRRYHPTCGWVATAEGGHLRWGIDGFVARLFDRVTSVVLPAGETDLEQGRVACWLMDDGELIPLRAPVSGRVTATNQAVQRDPGRISASPYDEGWLVELRGAGPLAALPGLCTAADRRATAAVQMARIQRSVLRHVRGEPRVGPTAADGGEPLTDLRRMLGTRRYHRVILTALRWT
jgi:glycine cleavage system H protein